MTRSKGYYNKETGEVDWYDARRIEDYIIERRNNPVAPMVIQDTMEPIKHHGTGLYTDSKSSFERMNEQSNMVVRETPMQFDTPTNCRPLNKKELQEVESDYEAAATRSLYELKSGETRLKGAVAERAKIINEQYEAVTGKSSKIKGSL